MDGHQLGDREGAEPQNPAYGRLTVNHRPSGVSPQSTTVAMAPNPSNRGATSGSTT